MDLDAILNDSIKKYPDGRRNIEHEINTLKRNLNIEEGFRCDICQKVIQHRANYNRHLKSHETTYSCFVCDRKFNRIDVLKRHERGHLVGYAPSANSFKCYHCGMGFNNYMSLFDHSKLMHSGQTGGNANAVHHKTSVDSALDDSVYVLTILPSHQDEYDLLTFFYNVRSEIMANSAERCNKVKHVKWYLNVQVEFVRETLEGDRDVSRPYFKSSTNTLLSKEDLSDDDLNEVFQKQFKSFDEYIARGSGWTLKKVLSMEVHTIQYRPIRGSSYFPIPKTLQQSHAIVNIKNQDKKCFLWSVLAHLHQKTNNPGRVSHYIPHEKELNMKGISYPVQTKQLPKFENQNDVSVNVIGFEDGNFFPIYISKHKDKKYQVDLLHMTKGNNAHYCYIRNLNRLLSRTKQSGRAYKFCRFCLTGFTSQGVLDRHLKYCSKHDAQHVQFPIRGEDNIVEFDDFSKQMKVPFVIYCDFEAFSRPLDTCSPNPSVSHTVTKTKFEACGYGYQVVCVDERYSKPPVIFRGKDAGKHLIQSLINEEQYIREILDNIEPLNMSVKNEETFRQTTHCFICGDKFTTTFGKVRDHCHVSGSLRFLDSYQCLQSSLSDLVNDLVKDGPHHFKSLIREFPSEEQRSLLLRKGVYPYTYMDGEDKFRETCLPPKDAFYNDLTKCHISDEDYEHAQKVNYPVGSRENPIIIDGEIDQGSIENPIIIEDDDEESDIMPLTFSDEELNDDNNDDDDMSNDGGSYTPSSFDSEDNWIPPLKMTK